MVPIHKKPLINSGRNNLVFLATQKPLYLHNLHSRTNTPQQQKQASSSLRPLTDPAPSLTPNRPECKKRAEAAHSQKGRPHLTQRHPEASEGSKSTLPWFQEPTPRQTGPIPAERHTPSTRHHPHNPDLAPLRSTRYAQPQAIHASHEEAVHQRSKQHRGQD